MAALPTTHAHLDQARDELMRACDDLVQQPVYGFQDAFMEALRHPYEAAARTHSSNNIEKTIIWRRSDLLDFLSIHFPQYAQQPTAFFALCASLTQKLLGSESNRVAENEDASEFVRVTFDSLKSILVQQYSTTRLISKDPFPIEPRVELVLERCPSIALFVPGSTSTNGDVPNDTTLMSILHVFQSDVLKKSKSWLGSWRARHLVLRWGVLEVHRRNLTARSFRHHSSSVSHNASLSFTSSYKGDNCMSAKYPRDVSAQIKNYDLSSLESIKLEHVSDTDAMSAWKAALTLTFQTSSFSSHCNLSNTVTQDIKTLTLGSGETYETLVSIRNHIATFALYLELSQRNRLPFLTKIRQLVAANAMVNTRLRIPRLVSPIDSIQRLSQEKQPLHGLVTALQLAFLQDPRVSTFEKTIAVLLNAGADPRALLHWDYATQVVFTRSSSSSSEQKKDHQQRQKLRKQLLLLDKVDSEGEDAASFQCCQVQADDARRWNLLMYLCWIGDVEGVHQLLSVTGFHRTSTSQSRTSSRQVATCLDHVNATGDTALHVAIKSGNEAVAFVLVESILFINARVVHQCDGHGEPVVHLAMNQRQWRVVDALVAGNAVDPRSYDALGKSALHLAIQLRAPIAVIARLIQIYRHFSPNGGLDGRAGRRGNNETPLSLAIKSGQEQVVALLLASGASPVGSYCQWSLACKREEAFIGDDDSVLHVAIKAGQELAAAALIAHKVDIYTVDSRGASSLALAIRYGLYAVAAALVDQHLKKKENQLGSKSWWVDQDTRKPVVMLACQAGQLELAAFLLDKMSQDQTSLIHLYSAQLLPLLVQISYCLGRQGEADEPYVSVNASAFRHLSDGNLEPGNRKSSDIRNTRPSIYDFAWHKGHFCLGENKVSGLMSFVYKNDSNTNIFYIQGIEALVKRILQLSGNVSIFEVLRGNDKVISAKTFALMIDAIVHLPLIATPTTSSLPKRFNSDELVATSPLHVAAFGGLSTIGLLRILLAFLLNSDPSAAAKLLIKQIGTRAETPLHAALEEGAVSNALLLLYTSRELQVRSPEVQPLYAQLLAMTNIVGNSALHLACFWPHCTSMRLVVELLLQEHADSRNWNNAGLTPLHVALREQCDNTFIELFLQYGQDLDLWTEEKMYEGEQDVESSKDKAKSAKNLISARSHNPLMLAVESQNASAFRALVRGGARTRRFMPRARIGLLQLAVHFCVRDPQLIACLLDDVELEHSAQSDTADQWGISPCEARTRLMDVWREERCGVNNKISVSQTVSLQPAFIIASSDTADSSECASIDRELLSPHSSTMLNPRAEETFIHFRALPSPPVLSRTTLEFLREKERVTLAIVANEARTEALDWLAKRIGQKKLLSDAHAQLQNAQNHRRTASGSNIVSRGKDELDASYVDASGGPLPSDQHLLEDLKAVAAKKFIDKHVAEAVAEARLSIEREKINIFQETGLYPGVSSNVKKHKKDNGKHCSLLVSAVSSTPDSELLAASTASITSRSSEEGNMMDDSYEIAEFWWAEHNSSFSSNENSSSWQATRGINMLGDALASTSLTSWPTNGRGNLLNGSFDCLLTLASRSFHESAESGRYDDKVLQRDSFTDSEQLVS